MPKPESHEQWLQVLGRWRAEQAVPSIEGWRERDLDVGVAAAGVAALAGKRAHRRHARSHPIGAPNKVGLQAASKAEVLKKCAELRPARRTHAHPHRRRRRAPLPPPIEEVKSSQ